MMKRISYGTSKNNDTSTSKLGVVISFYDVDEIGHLSGRKMLYAKQVNITVHLPKKKFFGMRFNYRKRK